MVSINKTTILRWLPVITWMILIFFLSSQAVVRSENFDLTDFILKKTAHILEYAALFAFVSRALSGNYKLAFQLCLAYAFTDEIHQLFTPGRGGKLTDVLVFDQLGLITAWITHHRFMRQKINTVNT